MFECRGCGAVLPGRRSRVYCSLVCQRETERKVLVARWLSTGVARPESKRGHYVRRHIFEEQNGTCALCGVPDVWQGLPLTFVLDHVDGDATNNRRDNLRLVCPNCDSQLPTYKSRNRGNGRYARRERYAAGKSY